MNGAALYRPESPYATVVPQTRAKRRAQEQAKARGERGQRRSRARIQKALSNYSKGNES